MFRRKLFVVHYGNDIIKDCQYVKARNENHAVKKLLKHRKPIDRKIKNKTHIISVEERFGIDYIMWDYAL